MVKKIIFFIPAIIFTILYGLVVIDRISSISSVVAVWLVLFLTGGILLSKNILWGGLLGSLPAIHLIYMGNQETGQLIKETPIGFLVLIFYIVCSRYIYYKSKNLNYSLL